MRYLMRITDMFLSMPYLMIAIALAAVLGPSKHNIILIMAILGWAGYARVLRGEVLRIKGCRLYQAGDRCQGREGANYVAAHISQYRQYPGCPGHSPAGDRNHHGIFLELSRAGSAATRTCLGVNGGRWTDYMFTSWWVSTWPGIAILLVVLSCNLLGDWLRVAHGSKISAIVRNG